MRLSLPFWPLLTAAALLGALPHPARADRVDDLLANLSSPRVEIRADAAEALATEKSKRAIPALIAASGDPVESVRAQAIRALAATADRTTTPTLITTLKDSNPNRRAGAAVILGILMDKQATDP